jgi:hypothetical protein
MRIVSMLLLLFLLFANQEEEEEEKEILGRSLAGGLSQSVFLMSYSIRVCMVDNSSHNGGSSSSSSDTFARV